jgi:hypothetical protein
MWSQACTKKIIYFGAVMHLLLSLVLIFLLSVGLSWLCIIIQLFTFKNYPGPRHGQMALGGLSTRHRAYLDCNASLNLWGGCTHIYIQNGYLCTSKYIAYIINIP